jgi:hypothetical protein
MLGRSAVYFREINTVILYLIFRGNDIHSGTAPGYTDKAHEEWLNEEELFSLIDRVHPQNRAFLVNYPSEVGNNRLAALSVTPPLTFMNQGAPIAHKLRQRNFAQHGQTILGPTKARCNRLGREILWAAFNAMAIAGLKLAIPSSELFKLVTFKDGHEICTLDQPPFCLDDEESCAYVTKMRSYFAWYRIQQEKYLIRITKDGYQIAQACIQLNRREKEDQFPVSERRNINSNTNSDSSSVQYLITQVLERKIVDGEVHFFSFVFLRVLKNIFVAHLYGPGGRQCNPNPGTGEHFPLVFGVSNSFLSHF